MLFSFENSQELNGATLVGLRWNESKLHTQIVDTYHTCITTANKIQAIRTAAGNI